MTDDKHTFNHGPLEVKAECDFDFDCIDILLNGEEVFCVGIVDDPGSEAAAVFKAFKQVYEAGMMNA